MTHDKLPFTPAKLLNCLSFLEHPILLLNGLSGVNYTSLTVGQSSPPPRFAILGHKPLKSLKVVKDTDYSSLTVYPDTQTSTHLEQPEHFISGWAGIIHYPQSHASEPEGLFNYYDASIYIDFESEECFLLSHYPLTEERKKELSQLRDREPQKTAINARKWTPGWTKRQYQAAFERVQDYLLAGDCYQVNLAMPFFCGDDLTDTNPLPLLEAFDAPFSGFFKNDRYWIATVSPERFVKVENGVITTSPIKGTSPRHPDPKCDEANRNQLLASEKNQAENLMIVDLLRNDLSRSAEPHSVKVEKLFALESHANVHHMVSTITAKQKASLTPIDVVRNAFPGGSITGAPKVRAMQIIEELELQNRGAYCGSMGYFDDSGLTDFNILIRTITATKDGAVCWGGGGIVVDSTMDDEYQEILNKIGKILATPI